MKKIILSIISVVVATLVNAQTPFEIWGATSHGGDGKGAIFRSTPSGAYQSIGCFRPTSPEGPTTLVEHPNGNFYGVTGGEGAYKSQTLFEFNPTSGIYTKIKDFNDTSGFYQTGPLFIASNGKIYGQTGNTYSMSLTGSLYEYDPASKAFTVLHYFGYLSDLDGDDMPLVEVAGKLYGISNGGGQYGDGGIFEINLATGVYALKKSLSISDRMKGFLDGQNGKLYSQTLGMYILEYDYVANTYQVLTPTNSAILTSIGGGFTSGNSSGFMGYTSDYIYTYSILSNSYAIIANIPPAINNPTLELCYAGAAKFYGITRSSPGVAKIYQYDSITDVFTTLKTMNYTEGETGTYGTIFLAADGNLYGSALIGGTYFGGVIYKYNIVSNVFTIPFNFNNYLQGDEPIMALTPMSNDKLIGRTHYGGTFNYGTVFTIDINTGLFSKKVNVTGANGGFGTPFVKTTPGKYYTTSVDGGTDGYGGILLYDSTLNTYTLRQSFSVYTANGSDPISKMVYATDGKLYGVTYRGGSFSVGTLYRYDPVANTITTLHNFSSAVSGQYPVGELIQAANGKLYGMSSSGGPLNRGMLFEYDISSSTFTVLYALSLADGEKAYSGLTEVLPGVFYGVTSQGGANNNGTIFKYDASLALFSTVFSFQASTSGAEPKGSLLFKDGMLYGTNTEFGPSSQYGVMFSFDPATSVFDVLRSFYPPSGYPADDGWLCPECFQSYLTAVCPPLQANSISIPSSVCDGSNLIMSVSSSDTSVTYTWYKNGVAIPTSDTATYVITGVSSTDAGNYYCTISNGCRIVNSANVPVSVLNPCTEVWPGDANHDSLVSNYDLLPIGLFYSQTGAPRVSISNAWQAFPATDWGTTQSNGFDINNVDCNGDGLIDDNDTLAVNLNFSMVHAIAPNDVSEVRATDPDLYLLTSNSTYNAGDWVNAEVWAGNSTTPVTNLYGIAFNINYDASLVEPGTGSITYPNSWLGTPATNTITISKIDELANIAYGGITRINHTNATGYGKIANFKFQAKTTITAASVLHLSVSNYSANDAVGAPVVFNTPMDSITISSATGIQQLSANNEQLTIHPNPFTSETTITFSTEQKHTVIKIMDVLGKEIKTINFSGKQLLIEKGEMQKVIYFVRITDENKKVVNKKIVLQ